MYHLRVVVESHCDVALAGKGRKFLARCHNTPNKGRDRLFHVSGCVCDGVLLALAASSHLKATVACDFEVPSLPDERREQAETFSESDGLY
jgi:hypothetical protein